MTADELIQEICEYLNLSSDESKSRIARRLNVRYKRVTSSLGLETARRSRVSQAAVVGNRTITFTGIEKIITVIDASTGKDVILSEITPDEMIAETIVSEPPTKYAVTRMYPTSVDIKLNCTPATTFTLYADAHVTATTLSGSSQPQFPESFHDILFHGVLADEYRKMEKIQLSKDAEADFERRLSDLRMWIAKSAWLDVYQGKNAKTKWWEQNWSINN